MSNESVPRTALGSPGITSVPRYSFSCALSLSPWKMETSSDSWSSRVVAMLSDFLKGREVLRSMILRKRPPGSPTPMLMGRTSTSTTPSICPKSMLCASSAAPSATASSGWTALDGSRPKKLRMRSRTSGMRLCPPTSSTSAMSAALRFRAPSTSSQTFSERSTRWPVSSTNSERETVASRS